jgi:hypothetical protein
MFEHLISHAPESAPIERLESIRRFTNDWEADASVRLRQGDVAVLETYAAQGRIHSAVSAADGCGQLLERWAELRQAGRDVMMVAATNESAAELNAAAQQSRIDAGELDPTAAVTLSHGEWALIGDEIQTRRNDRTLTTDTGSTVKNRQHWTIEDIGPDGSLTVVNDSGRTTLPRSYVPDSTSLAYASTAMAAQGRTVDESLVLVDGPVDAAGVYVPMTRGRDANDIWVVTDPTSPADAIDKLADALERRWIDQPAIEHFSDTFGRTSIDQPAIEHRDEALDPPWIGEHPIDLRDDDDVSIGGFAL